jgi:REP element-mobilizing transposase RayT
MDRLWFFTWRTYGSWLPGEEGFVGYYRASDGTSAIDNIPGELPTGPIPPLERYARGAMNGEPVILTPQQAKTLLAQFHETSAYKQWRLDAVAVMTNHVHLVFGVPGDPDPAELLKCWKSYASRALNRLGPRPIAPRWFADGGSKRRLVDEENWIGAVRYVMDQAGALLIWLSEQARRLAGAHGEPAT